MNKDKIRNILNIIFMIGAVVGVILYLSKNEERHYLGYCCRFQVPELRMSITR